MNRLLSRVRIILLSCLVGVVFVLTSGQQIKPHHARPDDVIKLKDELVKQDTEMHDSLPRGSERHYKSWADDYTEINEAGELLSKPEVRARYRANANRRPNIPPEDYALNFYRDTIVMTHVLKRKGMKNDKDGYPVIPTVYSFRVTHVFVKRNGEWQMVSTQWTPIAERQSKAAPQRPDEFSTVNHWWRGR